MTSITDLSRKNLLIMEDQGPFNDRLFFNNKKPFDFSHAELTKLLKEL